MASIEQLRRERDDLLDQQDTLSRKISKLRRASSIEASASAKFQQGEEIKATTQEREQVEAQIDALSEQISKAEQRPGGIGMAQGAAGALSDRLRPQSSAYRNARQRIDEALMQPPLRRAGRMGEIEHSLRRATHDEGGDEAGAHVRCYLSFEQARAHYLYGRHADARSLFEHVVAHLLDTDDDDPLLREAREFLAVIELQADIAPMTDLSRRGLEVRVQHIVTFISSSMSRSDLARSPAACMLYHELSQIVQSQRNPVAAEILGPQRMAELQVAVRDPDEEQSREQRHLGQEPAPLATDQSRLPMIDRSGER